MRVVLSGAGFNGREERGFLDKDSGALMSVRIIIVKVIDCLEKTIHSGCRRLCGTAVMS